MVNSAHLVRESPSEQLTWSGPAAHLVPGPVCWRQTSPLRHTARTSPHAATVPFHHIAVHADPGHHQDGAAFTPMLAATHPHRYIVITLALLIGGRR